MAPNSALDTADLLEALATELSPDAVAASDPDCDTVDGVRPRLCARVDSPDAVAAALEICRRLDAVVVPRGGGSHLGLGQPPERVDLLLDVSELNAVIEYRPADLTLAVAAGARLADVQSLLAGEGQMLALNPASEPSSTVGGMVAANLSGPRRAGSGTARDLVIGLEVAGVNGLVTRSGGMVVKNVTGYDLPKAHIGAFGTLGVITRVNLKITPRPSVERTLVVALPDPAAAGSAIGAVIDSPLVPSGFELIQRELTPGIYVGGGGPWLLGIRVAGTAGGVAAQLAMAAEAVRPSAAGEGATLEGADQERFWSDADALARAPADMASQTTCRLSALSSQTPSLLGSAADIGEDLGLRTVASARALHGVVRVRASGTDDAAGLTDFVQRLRTAAERLGGALVIESAPAKVKRAAGVWGVSPDAPDVQAMDVLRSAFDPGRIINRGRFVVT
ncbi:MAG: FAD-binding oxidoreductase [Chloroflexota bacterium]|nr:FAD-binding oxidoreductase [Chloroflexota bacterium]MDE2921211.1 FAD-binding oxidoreductase [Chloroflexota bacterium]